MKMWNGRPLKDLMGIPGGRRQIRVKKKVKKKRGG